MARKLPVQHSKHRESAPPAAPDEGLKEPTSTRKLIAAAYERRVASGCIARRSFNGPAWGSR